MTLMPRDDKKWSTIDMVEWLIIIIIICVVMRLYFLSIDFIKSKLFKNEFKKYDNKTTQEYSPLIIDEGLEI